MKRRSEITESTRENNIEDSTRKDSGDEGGDLMETDEEVLIESETQEDSAFLDGEEQEDCYGALNREREAFRDSDQEYEDGNPELTTPEPSKEKTPLKETERQIRGVPERALCPWLHFRKYGLNAIKESLFPVLVQNEQVQFSIKRNHNCA